VRRPPTSISSADEYEANKYYFLSHYFRDNYENALRTLPTVNSGMQITNRGVGHQHAQ
jgi:cell surface protein SprA